MIDSMVRRARWSSGRRPRWPVALIALIAFSGLGTVARAAVARIQTPHGPVPQGFVGMDTDGPLLARRPKVDLDAQLGAMVTNGVQSVRLVFSWAAAQPYAAAADVPAGQTGQFTDVAGRPTNFHATDHIVSAAARRRLSVLPTVLYAPRWDARAPANPHGFAMPRRATPYAAYLTVLIGRYGPEGSFWRQNPSIPKMPIRAWQIWNEPNISRYWHQPFAPSYASLLRAAHTAVRRADPSARVVLGALTNAAWSALSAVYRVRGARSQFDVVSVNAFTKLPANVILYLRNVRSVMKHYGDARKPLLATELSWPSGAGVASQRYDFDTTQAGQAHNIAALLPLIGRNRVALHLAGFDYYTWMGDERRGNPAFDFAGLLRYVKGKVTVKPALGAFRGAALALERCRRKGAVASSCIR